MRRFQKQHLFWLNLNNPDESELANTIDELKAERRYSKAIRDGLTLVTSLWRGDITPLLAMFPWVKDAIIAEYLSQTPERPKSGDSGSNQGRELSDAEKAHMDAIARYLMQQGVSSIPDNVPPSELIPPKFDDIQLEVTTAKTDADNRSDWNFAISSTAVVYGGDFSMLPPQILDYGIRTGRIPPDAAPRRKTVTNVTPAPDVFARANTSARNPKPIAVAAGVTLEVPNFDDLSL